MYIVSQKASLIVDWCWYVEVKEVFMPSSSEWNILFPQEVFQLSMSTCLLHWVLKKAE